MSQSKQQPVPMVPMRRGVLFPGTMMTLPVGRARSLAALSDLKPGDLLLVGTQRDAKVEEPVLADLHELATLARVQRIARTKDRRGVRVLLEGLHRVRITDLAHSDPHWAAVTEDVTETGGRSDEAQLLATTLTTHIKKLVGETGGSLMRALDDTALPTTLADRVAASLDLDHATELELYLNLDVPARLRALAKRVNEAHAKFEVKKKIEEEVRKTVHKSQRDAILRAQLEAIKRELRDGDGGSESEEDGAGKSLADRIQAADLPDEVQKVADRELKRLESLPEGHPESNVARTYLEWLADLPWEARAEVNDDLDAVSARLDADHHGLEDVKRRVLEHMAVLKLKGRQRGTILCFAGPPGVGKTSLGKSIAEATGRPFVRIALGGVRDEAEIRGHRRTYVGAVPGRIINALRKVEAKNPVILLDEVDKLGATGWGGRPEAALLELLDPEQNDSFTDHYLEVPFDLSEALFLCTVNDLSQLSRPLRDRLEIVEISGYTPEEKVKIARKHLLSTQLTEHALAEDAISIGDDMLELIVRDYTRESGVRQLKREIAKLCRAVALEVARSKEAKPPRIDVSEERLREWLGKVKFRSEVAARTSVPGVATGLAWTPVGGDILFIETSRMKGKGQLQITGQLGDVMKESAKAALSYLRSNAELLGIDEDFLEHQDVHIHVPAGAVPKDGPSAGVTIFSALTSLVSGRRVRNDTAMTGEATLRGQVLPVGGIKAKVLAAHRAGLRRVILPKDNEPDFQEVPESVREEMEAFFVEDMKQVLELALEDDAELSPLEGGDLGSGTSHAVA